jgi:hypothetical protein
MEKNMRLKFALYVIPIILMVSLQACGGPTATPTKSQLPVENTPVAAPEELYIASTSSFIDRTGTYRVVGMVINNSHEVLSSIQMTLALKDAPGNSLLKDENGNVSQTTTFYPMLYTLAPGDASPFVYSYDTTFGTPASFNVSITGQTSGEANRASLDEENIQIVDDGAGGFYLTGRLVNKGSQWVHIKGLAGGVLDDSNTLLTANWTSTYTTELAPAGDTLGRDKTPFEISFPEPEGGTQWRLFVDADAIDNVTDYALALTLTNGYFDQNRSYHVVGWITNNSSQSLDSLVIAGLYSEDGTVLDASYAFVPIPIKPGASAPFSVSSFESINFNLNQASQVSTNTAQFDTWFTIPTPYEFVDLTPSRENVQKDVTSWTITGYVTNSSGRSLSGETVVCMVMDGQNKLIEMQYTSILPTGDAINPGDEYPYSVTILLDPAIDTIGFATITQVIGDVK